MYLIVSSVVATHVPGQQHAAQCFIFITHIVVWHGRGWGWHHGKRLNNNKKKHHLLKTEFAHDRSQVWCACAVGHNRLTMATEVPMNRNSNQNSILNTFQWFASKHKLLLFDPECCQKPTASPALICE